MAPEARLAGEGEIKVCVEGVSRFEADESCLRSVIRQRFAAQFAQRERFYLNNGSGNAVHRLSEGARDERGDGDDRAEHPERVERVAEGRESSEPNGAISAGLTGAAQESPNPEIRRWCPVSNATRLTDGRSGGGSKQFPHFEFVPICFVPNFSLCLFVEFTPLYFRYDDTKQNHAE